MSLDTVSSLVLLKTERVSIICFGDQSNKDPTEFAELSKRLKGLKEVVFESNVTQFLSSLPSTVRKIDYHYVVSNESNIEEIICRFPNLIEIAESLIIEELKNTKLRVINPMISETEEKFELRPRKIQVEADFACQLNNHPELFEKVEQVDIWTDEFNFDVLPSEIKKIYIQDKVNEESVTLNRLEKEHE